MPKKDFYDVFLSYSHNDSEYVEALAEKLSDLAKLRVWLDKWILVPGESWQQAMAMGLQKAKSCAICIGSKTPKGWFREEIERALNRQVQDSSFRAIPILLPDSDNINVDNFLELRTWVDFRNGLEDRKAFHLLVSGINGVPPGRTSGFTEKNENIPPRIKDALMKIRQFHEEKLIDDEIAHEYQRRLLDSLFEI